MSFFSTLGLLLLGMVLLWVVHLVRWDPVRTPSPLEVSGRTIGLALVGLLLALLALPRWLGFELSPHPLILRFLVGSTAELLAALLLVLLIVRETGQPLVSLGFQQTNDRSLLLALLAYIAFLPCHFALLQMGSEMARLVNLGAVENLYLPLFLDAVSAKHWPDASWLILNLLLLGPLVEEVVFRGFLYAALRKPLGRLPALLTSSLLFALSHQNPVSLLPVTALGLLLGWTYERSGSIIVPIWIHTLHNAFGLGVALAPHGSAL